MIYDGYGNAVELDAVSDERLKVFNGELTPRRIDAYRNKDIGNYWRYDENKRITVDGEVIEPHSYVYVANGMYKGASTKVLKSIHIPYTTTHEPKTYDVIIVGGGAGGIGTAYALKDSGLNVALVERLDTLGGTHCNGGVGLMIASPIGDWYKTICEQAFADGYLDFRAVTNVKYKEVGSGSTFEKRWRGAMFTDPTNRINGFSGNHTNINDVWFSKRYMDDLKDSIDIYLNLEVCHVTADDGKIKSITCRNLITGEMQTLTATHYVDCSADAVLFTNNGDLAKGTDYYSGTDGRARFNETVYGATEEPNEFGINTVEPVWFSVGQNGIMPDAPKDMDSFTFAQKSNYDWLPPNGDAKVKMSSRSYSTQMSTKDFLTKPYDWNYRDGYKRAEAFVYGSNYDSGLRQTRFGGICKMLAIRESYRVACEQTVDQAYLTKQITSSNIASEKVMALSTWYVDIHNQSYSCVSNIANGIPYGAMIPKCYTNVLVASRCYGASHIGLSSLRLVKTMLDLGYSAGKAMIDICSHNRTDVRDADTNAIQNATGIKNTMAEVQQYFYGSSVSYTEIA